jgi:hypothetical protein
MGGFVGRRLAEGKSRSLERSHSPGIVANAQRAIARERDIDHAVLKSIPKHQCKRDYQNTAHLKRFLPYKSSAIRRSCRSFCGSVDFEISIWTRHKQCSPVELQLPQLSHGRAVAQRKY